MIHTSKVSFEFPTHFRLVSSHSLVPPQKIILRKEIKRGEQWWWGAHEPSEQYFVSGVSLDWSMSRVSARHFKWPPVIGLRLVSSALTNGRSILGQNEEVDVMHQIKNASA